MSHSEIIIELCSRGERNIRFPGNGLIVSKSGKNITTHWIVICNTIVSTRIEDENINRANREELMK